MILVLIIAIGLLLGCAFVAIAILAIMFVNDRKHYLAKLNDRVINRKSKAIDLVLQEDWKGTQLDKSTFERLWRRVAVCLRVDPTLLRPQDRLDDFIVSTVFYWRTPGNDIADFLEECRPDDNPIELMKQDICTVADLVHVAQVGKVSAGILC